MHILLFGSPFNPPHLGHQIVIRQAFELIQDFDELWLLPNYRHAFGKDLAPVADRLAMCQLLVQEIVMQESKNWRAQPDAFRQSSTHNSDSEMKNLLSATGKHGHRL